MNDFEEKKESDWNEKTDTNQYVNWEGQDKVSEQEEQPKDQGQQRKEYGTQYGYYGTSQNSQNYYSQNGGQWDCNKYEPQQKKKSGCGFKIVLGVIAVVVGLCIIGFAAFGLLSALGGKIYREANKFSISIGKEESNPSEETESIIYGDVPELSLEKKPAEEKAITTEGALTASEVYKKVIPSVVGVLQYQYSMSFDPAGTGSGIIISDDGYIVTNAHVVKGAEAVKVILYNEEEYEATIIGSDAQTDIAVLKIDANNLTAAELGDSNTIEIGETAYALGNPGGLSLQSSITEGIISGLNRNVTVSDSSYSMTLIQTSAAINPGNSGGALANEFGQVVGITNSKLVSTSYEGVGFAIPSADVIPIVEQLIKQGYVSGRAYLGITGRTIDALISRYYRVPEGVQIASIDENSSFKGTEAAIGDIIVKLGDTDITSMDDVSKYLAQHKAGEKIEVKLYRYSAQRSNDKEITVTIVLAEKKS